MPGKLLPCGAVYDIISRHGYDEYRANVPRSEGLQVVILSGLTDAPDQCAMYMSRGGIAETTLSRAELNTVAVVIAELEKEIKTP